MKTFAWIGGVILVIVIGLWIGTRYFSVGQNSIQPGEKVKVNEENPLAKNVQKSDTATPPGQALEWKVEEVVGGLDTPWSIVFTSPERILVTERVGRLRVVEKGMLQSEPLYVFPEVEEKGEEGLMSLALSPEYPQDHALYVSLAYPSDGKLFVKVMRFRDDGTSLSEPKIIRDKIPAAQFHAGCRIAFGPDGKLYITTGDATDKALPQDKDSLGGKILRLNPDGSIPNDNPFPGNLVWSYGHRNPQGIGWQPGTGAMYAAEHGPSGFDGPGGGDEVNHIVKGGNYGWPLVSHERKRDGTVAPLLVFTPAEAPAALLSYSGRIFPQWQGHLFFGALKGEGLMHIVMDGADPDKVISFEKLSIGSYGRIREVMEGPDGLIYFSTSNRDGRGNPDSRDDRVLRIVPKKQ